MTTKPPLVIDDFDAFTDPDNPYQFLSNFFERPIIVHGRRYPTTEHYFQAMKMVHAADAERIRRAASPGIAKGLGRSQPMRPEWPSVRVDVMLTALRAKFTQHADLRRALLETGTALLIEGNTWGDRLWGVVNGRGENLLGLCLMIVRAELRTASL